MFLKVLVILAYNNIYLISTPKDNLLFLKIKLDIQKTYFLEINDYFKLEMEHTKADFKNSVYLGIFTQL